MVKADVVVGLGFGDEGKGRTISELVNRQIPDYIVRATGSAQNAHNVEWIDKEGEFRHHTFKQLGSSGGELVPTIICQTTPVSLERLLIEFDKYSSQFKKSDDVWNFLLENVHIDKEALLITPLHALTTIYKEKLRGKNRHGSTGVGISEAKMYEKYLYSIKEPDKIIRIEDVLNPYLLQNKLYEYAEYLTKKLKINLENIDEIISNCIESFEEYAEALELQSLLEDGLKIKDRIENSNYIIFENGQGMLLDENYGFFPNVTYGKALPSMEQVGDKVRLKDLNIFLDDVNIIGAIRTFCTRHGFGVFPSENDNPELIKLEKYNKYGEHQGGWRVGSFDETLFWYALDTLKKCVDQLPLNELSITHVDVENLKKVVYNKEIVLDVFDKREVDAISHPRQENNRIALEKEKVTEEDFDLEVFLNKVKDSGVKVKWKISNPIIGKGVE